MTKPARSLPVDATVDEAIRLLADARISCLPLVGEGGHVVGVISESDFLRVPLERGPRAHARPLAVPPLGLARSRRGHDQRPVHDPLASGRRRRGGRVRRAGSEENPSRARGPSVGVISRSDVVVAHCPDAMGRSKRTCGCDWRPTVGPGWRVRVSDAEVEVSGLQWTRDAHLAEAIAASVRGIRRVVVLAPE